MFSDNNLTTCQVAAWQEVLSVAECGTGNGRKARYVPQWLRADNPFPPSTVRGDTMATDEVIIYYSPMLGEFYDLPDSVVDQWNTNEEVNERKFHETAPGVHVLCSDNEWTLRQFLKSEQFGDTFAELFDPIAPLFGGEAAFDPGSELLRLKTTDEGVPMTYFGMPVLATCC